MNSTETPPAPAGRPFVPPRVLLRVVLTAVFGEEVGASHLVAVQHAAAEACRSTALRCLEPGESSAFDQLTSESFAAAFFVDEVRACEDLTLMEAAVLKAALHVRAYGHGSLAIDIATEFMAEGVAAWAEQQPEECSKVLTALGATPSAIRGAWAVSARAADAPADATRADRARRVGRVLAAVVFPPVPNNDANAAAAASSSVPLSDAATPRLSDVVELPQWLYRRAVRRAAAPAPPQQQQRPPPGDGQPRRTPSPQRETQLSDPSAAAVLPLSPPSRVRRRVAGSGGSGLRRAASQPELPGDIPRLESTMASPTASHHEGNSPAQVVSPTGAADMEPAREKTAESPPRRRLRSETPPVPAPKRDRSYGRSSPARPTGRVAASAAVRRSVSAAKHSPLRSHRADGDNADGAAASSSSSASDAGVDVIDLDAESSGDDDIVVIDGTPFVTGDAVPRLMQSQPWKLPQAVVVKLRRPLPPPPTHDLTIAPRETNAEASGAQESPEKSVYASTPFELEHHYTLTELRKHVADYGLAPAGATVSRMTKAALVTAILSPHVAAAAEEEEGGDAA